MKILKYAIIWLIVLASVAIALADTLAMEAKYGYSVNSFAIFLLPAGFSLAWLIEKFWHPGKRQRQHKRKSEVVKTAGQGWAEFEGRKVK